MIFFKFIYALFFWFYSTIGLIWSKDKPKQLKKYFDAQCIAYLKSIEHLNNNDLIKATYPIVIGSVIFGFFEVWLASKLFGEGHLIVQQMILVMVPVAYIIRMGYLTDEKIEVLKADCQKALDKWIDLCFTWTPRIGAIIILSLIPEVLAGRQPDPEQVASMIGNNLNPTFIIGFISILFVPVFLYLLLFAFPILIARVGILNFIRWIVKKTLADNNTKPFVVISWVVATFTLLDAFFVLRAFM
jgi:hypothetical protein